MTDTRVSNTSRAYFGLMTLTLINLLNYLDRYIVPGSLTSIEASLKIDHDQAGWLLSIFFIVYMVASPIGGYFGDRYPRRMIVGISVLVWSLATVASGFATSFEELLVARAFIGVGEAGYATVAPSIIADLFARERRASMLSVFYMAIPLGAALGFGLGGYMSAHYSWNMAFFVSGAPGLFFGVAAFFMPEPARGASDAGKSGSAKVPFKEGILALRGNSGFWFNTAGLTMMTFSIGGLGNWLPAFLETERGFHKAVAGIGVGAVTAGAGIIGTLAGGWLGDWADKRKHYGSMYVSGFGLLLAVPFMLLATANLSKAGILAMIFIAQFFLFLNSGPINAAIVNSVAPGFRAFAMGINVLIIHAFGDAASPKIIGKIGKYYDLATAIWVNAVPVIIGGIVLIVGVRVINNNAKKDSVQPLP